LYSFFFNDTATTEIYTLSLHDALPIYSAMYEAKRTGRDRVSFFGGSRRRTRSEEHTSELQSLRHLVCRLLLEQKKVSYPPAQQGPHHSQRWIAHARTAGS